MHLPAAPTAPGLPDPRQRAGGQTVTVSRNIMPDTIQPQAIFMVCGFDFASPRPAVTDPPQRADYCISRNSKCNIMPVPAYEPLFYVHQHASPASCTRFYFGPPGAISSTLSKENCHDDP